MGSAPLAVSGTAQETPHSHRVEASPAGPHSSQEFPSAIPDWSKRIPALDGLRGIAILLVLMYHSVCRGRSRLPWPVHAAGRLTWTGVDLFFVLSGFLIGGILLDAKASPRYFNTFYIRRVYRIFPLYFLVTGFVLLLYARFHLQPAEWHGPLPWLRYLTFTANAVYPGITDLGMMWSLCIEEQFYLVIPFVIRFLPLLFSVPSTNKSEFSKKGTRPPWDEAHLGEGRVLRFAVGISLYNRSGVQPLRDDDFWAFLGRPVLHCGVARNCLEQ